MGKPCEFKNYEPSFVDGCGGKSVLSEMWPLANQVIDGGCSVPVKVSIADLKYFINFWRAKLIPQILVSFRTDDLNSIPGDCKRN